MHFLVFVGANAAIAHELKLLEKSAQNLKVVAPAVRKQDVGLTSVAIERSQSDLLAAVRAANPIDEKCRLTVCSFPSDDYEAIRLLWRAFGGAAWVQFVSLVNLHKPTLLRQEVDRLLQESRPLLHKMSSSVYGRRKTSPLALPIKNFQSELVETLKMHWYRHLNEAQLDEKIADLTAKHKVRICNDRKSFADDRTLIFCPAKDTECHGLAHPTGDTAKSFLRGKFRFGVSLFPGFHFDVRDGKGRNLQTSLVEADFGPRDMRPEKREYVNIFPNDFLLPKRHK
jgi:hypothetical protein